MNASVEDIKKLRNMCSVSIMECKKALEEVEGDIDRAKGLLQRRGFELAAKKATRKATEGRIEAYVHLGAKIGAMVELNCETDFVARNEEFACFAKELAMQVVAMNPSWIKKEDVPKEVLSDLNKEELENFFEQNCLLEQLFIKDASCKIKERLTSLIAKVGENIVIRRFVRFQLGEKEDEKD